MIQINLGYNMSWDLSNLETFESSRNKGQRGFPIMCCVNRGAQLMRG